MHNDILQLMDVSYLSRLKEEKKKTPDKTLDIYVNKYWNYSASELMYLYAKNNSSVNFERDKYMHVTLTIEGKKYQCLSWTIRPSDEDKDLEKVSIYLEEVK